MEFMFPVVENTGELYNKHGLGKELDDDVKITLGA